MTETNLHTKRDVLSAVKDLILPRVGGESRGEQIFFSAAVAAVSFLLSGAEAFFGTSPFGAAFLAVLQNRVFLAYFAAVIGILIFGGGTAPVYILLFSLLVAARLFLSRPREGGRILPPSRAFFHEKPAIRLLTAGIGGFLLSLYQLLIGGFRLPSLLYSGVTVVFVPLFAALFLPFLLLDITLPELLFRHKIRLEERLPMFGSLSLCAALLSVGVFASVISFSLMPFGLFGISFAHLAAAFFTLYASYRRDAVFGLIIGAVSILPAFPESAPAFLLLGFVSGLLWRFGTLYALLGGVVSAAAGLLLSGGVDGFLSASPAILLSAALFWPLFLAAGNRGKPAPAAPDTTVYYNKNSDLLRMKRLSDAFSGLSGTFESMTEYMKAPDRRETAALCHNVIAAHCRLCDRAASCKYTDIRRQRAVAEKMAERLSGGDRSLDRVFPPEDRGACPAASAMMTDILSAYSDERRLREENPATDLLSADYAMLSKLLSDAARRDAEEREEDKRMSADLLSALETHGGFRGSVAVFGKRARQILVSGNYWEGERLSVEEIRSLFESMLCCRLSEPSFDFSGGQMTVETHTERRFAVDFITASTAGSGEMSGDVTRSFENAEGYSYKLLSDGMGSGKTALATATLTGEFLKELLSSGAAADTALKMLNRVIRQKGCECSATIDLLEVDLLYGRASFIKSGAAASYVRRGRDVFRIRSKTMPLGILKSMDAERIHFDVEDGDVIILLSDGVSQTPEDAPWLLRLLSEGWDDNLPTMAEKILDAARDAGRDDDKTVGLCRITDVRRGNDIRRGSSKRAAG